MKIRSRSLQRSVTLGCENINNLEMALDAEWLEDEKK